MAHPAPRFAIADTNVVDGVGA